MHGRHRAGSRRTRRLARLAVSSAIALCTVTCVGVATSPAANAATFSAPAAAIDYALSKLGDSYVWGASGPNAFDCSGLTYSAYRSAGINIPRVSRDQYRALPKVSRANLQAGDLIFYAYNTADSSTIHHVAMYLSPGWMLEAPYSGARVRITPIRYYGLMAYGVRPAPNSGSLLSIPVGSSGDRVVDVQKRMRANGISVTIDGTYDSGMQQAVHRFQVAHGLPGSGLIGPLTWEYLVAGGLHQTAY